MALSFIHSNESVEKEINGEVLRFYPLSLPISIRLRPLAQSIARAFAAFQASKQQYTGHETEDLIDPEGGSMSKFKVEAASVAHIQEKRLQTEQSYTQIIEIFTAPPHLDEVCLALADSLRDYRKENDLQTSALAKELKEIDIPTAAAMVRALLEANAKQFGVLGETVSQVLQKNLEDLTGTTTEDGLSSKTDTSSAFVPESPEMSSMS